MKTRILLFVTAAALLAALGTVPASAETHVCRGLLTANWTEGVANFTPDGGTRVIRADNINDDCLFDPTSPEGRKIMRICQMGFGCEVKAQIINSVDHPADVYLVGKVLSVVNVSKPR